MPTEPPSATHNSGPPPLGQPPASSPHLPQHHGYAHPNANPNHPQQHSLPRPINAPAPPHAHYALPNSRNMPQMPAQPPAPAAPSAQQPAQRQLAATFYPVSGYGNNMQPNYPQVPGQFPMGEFMYPQQPFMSSMHHNPAAQQQPQQVNPRQPAQFSPPNATRPQVPPRQFPARGPVPQQRKKILRIVDPDSNEEVKVFKAESTAERPAAGKRKPDVASIDEEASSPPADNAKSETTTPSDKAGSEPRGTAAADVTSQPSPPLPNSSTTNGDTADATVSASSSHTSTTTTQPPVAAADTVLPSPADDAAVGTRSEVPSNRVLRDASADSVPKVAVPRSTAPSPKDADPVDASDVSSSTFADAQSDTTDLARPNSTVMTDKSSATGTEAIDTLSTPNDADSVKSSQDAGVIPPSETNGSDVASESKPPALNKSADAQGESAAGAPGKDGPTSTDPAPSDSADIVAELKDEFPRFADGERCVYPLVMMTSMKKLMSVARANELEPKLGSVLKSAPRSQDGRSGRASRANSGPLGDVRGRSFLGQGGSGFQVPVRGAPPPSGMGGGFGSSDQIDLLQARSQPPPPIKNQSGRQGDPRGSRTMGPGRGRPDHMMRNQGSFDQFMPLAPSAPVEKLKRTENGWKRNKEADDAITAKVKQVRSLLNKLTIEKFDKIFTQIVEIDISNFETLTGVVKEIFEKTLFEPKFSNMYADLCRRLDSVIQPILDKKQDSTGKLNFKKILLNNCKDEFTRFANSSATPEDSTSTADETEGAEDEDEASKAKKKQAAKAAEEAKASTAKKRMLANVQFIGELFLKDLLREQIIHKNCIQKLLSLPKEEDVLEALCKLISKTGAKLTENKAAVKHIDAYFSHLQHISNDATLPARIRFMAQDLIEQRTNSWKVRREESKAKTIAEIHQDIEKEERAKQEAAQAMKDRRNRGSGGMHGRDRGGGNHPTRVHMTMAMNRTPHQNVSRTTASLEKYSSRAGAGSALPGLQSMRLGPGGPKGGAPGLPSLRPNGSGGRFNVLGGGGQQSENREQSASGPAADPRRMKTTKSIGMHRRTASKPEPEVPQEKVLDAKEVRNQVQRKLKYYWLEKDLPDTLELIDKEFSDPNHPAFLKEALKQSFEAKVSEAVLSEDVFKGLVGTVINPKYFVQAFTDTITAAPSMEMDNPRVLEFLGRYIGCCAATKKLGGPNSGVDLGLGFLTKSFDDYSDKKKATKLIVQVFQSLSKHMEPVVTDEEERKKTVKSVFESLKIDLTLAMKTWNFMRGLSIFSDMLKDSGLKFLIPTIDLEIGLGNAMAAGPTLESVTDVLKQYGEAPSGVLAQPFMRVVTRVSFDWLLVSSGENKDLFKEAVAKAVVNYYKNHVPQEAQMAALLGVQEFLAKNQETLPATFGGEKVAVAVLHLLYDADVVEEETLVAWKDDTELSAKVEGKEKMLMDSSKFFKWLAEADEEE